MHSCGFKASETLLGIETGIDTKVSQYDLKGFKASETLLGIETYQNNQKVSDQYASKPLKPF